MSTINTNLLGIRRKQTSDSESGWSDFAETERQLRRLGKSDDVIELLRHTPQALAMIAGNSTRQVEWRDESRTVKDLAKQSDANVREWFTALSYGNPPSCQLDANQITITFGGEEECNLVVNCATGEVYPHSMSDIQDDFFGKYMAGDHTKLPPPRDAAILFEEWRQQWLDLVWIFALTQDPTVLIEGYGDDEEFQAAKNVYIDCGWPKEFRREECIEKLGELDF
ncbi:Hypothetical protein R9X50_00557100 [Acrodontium crateriforme]|uniref:Uncharacterized protein n=1 Tax=Acrodontium crateriforme TaxID=150365 RepID=A0AAQ3M6S6_9PEZI|nr:Hypothetical protein R9X50_00557100 [Acrodontium crateriforme]